MSHLTTSSALGARPALAREPMLATRRLSAASWLAIAFFAGALLFAAVAPLIIGVAVMPGHSAVTLTPLPLSSSDSASLSDNT